MASLARPSNDRVIAGVCSGIARRFGLSSNVVRLIFVLSMLLPDPGNTTAHCAEAVRIFLAAYGVPEHAPTAS